MPRPLLALLAGLWALSLCSCFSTELGKRDLKVEIRNDGNDSRIEMIYVAVGTEELFGELPDAISAVQLIPDEVADKFPYAQEFSVPTMFESPKLTFSYVTERQPADGIAERLISSRTRLKSCLLVTLRKRWVSLNMADGIQVLVLARINGQWKMELLGNDEFQFDRHIKLYISGDVRRVE